MELWRSTELNTSQPSPLAPIIEALIKHVSKNPTRFHIPGHNGGSSYGQDDPMIQWLSFAAKFDVTELPGLDDLHSPHGAIAEAQQLAAAVYGATHTWFMVGGSTVGNLASIHAITGPGELILMQRNVHKSALHALMLAGAGAVFISPERCPATGIYTSITAESVRQGINKYPHCKAVFLQNPNYYGICADVQAIVEVAHAHQIPVIVDEAHGAHFSFHPLLPASALQYGADVVIQSTHKMLPALTMGAMLHLQGEYVSKTRIERRLRMIQTSSPSYLILASLDYARYLLQRERERLFEQAIKLANEFVTMINQMNMIFVAWDGTGTPYRVDPMKKLIYDRTGNLSGYQIQTLLAEKQCYVEMADERYALCVFNHATKRDQMHRLIAALEEIAVEFHNKKKGISQKITNIRELWPDEMTKPIFFNMDDSSQIDTIDIEISQSLGKVNAEMVIPYPPGIPLLYPGELITAEALKALLYFRDQGVAVQGLHDHTLQQIRVYKH
jgi:arginine decarboxylase